MNRFIWSPSYQSIKRNSFVFKREYIEKMDVLFDNEHDKFCYLMELISKGLDGVVEGSD